MNGATSDTPDRELPGGQGDERERRPPPPATEHRRARHRDRTAHRRRDADRIQGRRRTEHERGDADDSERARGESDDGRAKAEHGPAEQQDDDRSDGARSGRNAAGKPLGGDEQEHEEEPHVEHREDRDPQAPAGRRQLPRDDDQEQRAGRERTSAGGQQRPSCRQQLRGNPVVRAPQHRPDRGLEREGDSVMIRHRISIARRRTTCSRMAV